MDNRDINKQRVITVSIWTDGDTYDQESLDELNALVKVAGAEVVGSMTQNMDSYRNPTLMGKGKVEELKNAVIALSSDLVVFDNPLSGIQMRNLERELDCPVLDRTAIILDIFASRATSNEGKLQVQLAQLLYRKNHLIGEKNFSRLAGGIGTRGPGEQKLEIDRRRINRDIDNVKKKLADVRKHRATMQKNRLNQPTPLISIVGYTNAGKSSLINRILREGKSSGSFVLEQDMLFATLHPNVRKVAFPGGFEIFLSDTVGFVSHLPTELIEAFSSTLEEIENADAIIHVLDGSSDQVELQYETTRKLLKDLKVSHLPTLLFFNKMDLVEETNLPFPKDGEIMIQGSIRHDEDFTYFYKNLKKILLQDAVSDSYLIPYDRQDIASFLLNTFETDNVEYGEEGVHLTAKISKKARENLKEYRIRNV